MTRVLITGGCGFIGSNLVEFLLKQTNWEFNILDNLSTGRLKDIEVLHEFQEKINFFKGDIANYKDVSKAIKGCEFVVNLAAQTGVLDSINNPFKDEKVNIRGILNLLQLSKESNIKRFIQASSGAALGEQEIPIHELKVPKPISPYGASKLAGEAYCSAFSYSYGLRCIVLRFSNVYGPKSYNKGSVIAKFIKKILKGETIEIYGDGYQTRDFIYVDDISNGIYLSLVKNLSNFQVFQLGTGLETSINSLMEKIKEVLNENSYKIPDIVYTEQKSGEILRNYTDISKAKEILGYSIKKELDQGLRETFKWFLNNFD
ncbi:MAG: NAD-dependent epimerase/dehydratase family protein [Candidatus Hermodarchaeota archaeon]